MKVTEYFVSLQPTRIML